LEFSQIQGALNTRSTIGENSIGGKNGNSGIIMDEWWTVLPSMHSVSGSNSDDGIYISRSKTLAL
jgi:hypothetical protein